MDDSRSQLTAPHAAPGGSPPGAVLFWEALFRKEGLLLSLAAKWSADGKQTETTRELVLIYPARTR